jgi:two-component system, OmpR family, alkaline phosphatase synthesis response regulator PhoP
VKKAQTGLKMDNNAKKPKILIVDDNIPNLELLQAYLEDSDYDIEQAQDGYQAIEMIDTDKPDLVILDVMMPKISGFEVCKKLKTDPKTADLPIIMVTALSEMGDIERAIDCGTDDFLSKPVNRIELLTRVKTMLRIKDLTDKLERSLEYISQIEARLEN